MIADTHDLCFCPFHLLQQMESCYLVTSCNTDLLVFTLNVHLDRSSVGTGRRNRSCAIVDAPRAAQGLPWRGVDTWFSL